MLTIDLISDQVETVARANVVYHWLILNKASSVFVPSALGLVLKPSLRNEWHFKSISYFSKITEKVRCITQICF